jgi:hypothetical protein
MPEGRKEGRKVIERKKDEGRQMKEAEWRKGDEKREDERRGMKAPIYYILRKDRSEEGRKERRILKKEGKIVRKEGRI